MCAKKIGKEKRKKKRTSERGQPQNVADTVSRVRKAEGKKNTGIRGWEEKSHGVARGLRSFDTSTKTPVD